MKQPLGIGIIGAGGIARGAHIGAYQAYPELCKVQAVCDIIPERAKAFAAEYNIPHVYDNYHDLLKLKCIDAVSVCTPNIAHMKPTVDALAAGKHVLCEKPIARNAIEGAEMVAASRKHGRKLQIGLNMRFEPEQQMIKSAIDEGQLGNIYYARAQALRRRGVPTWGVFTDKAQQGGGPMIDIGVHIIDTTLWFMGHPKPVSVTGMTYREFGGRSGHVNEWGPWDPATFTVEDFACGLVRFENGAVMTIESSFCANIERDMAVSTVLGTEAGACNAPCKIFKEQNGALTETQPTWLLRGPSSHTREVKAFLEAIINDTEVYVTGEQGLMATQIIDAVYKSTETGHEVIL